MNSRAVPSLSCALLILSPCACNPGFDTSGFEQLTSKAPRAIDLPGEDFGDVGGFEPVHAMGREGEVEAIAGVDEDGRVRLVHADQSGCTAMTLPEGAAPGRALPAVQEDLLAVLDQPASDDPGQLRFFDMGCDEALPAMRGALPIALSERLVPFRLLVLAGTDLLAIDAARRQIERVRDDVSSASLVGDYVVVHASGIVVFYDLSLELVSEHGQKVTEVIALQGNGKVALVDRDALWVLDGPLVEPRRIEVDVCDLGLADGPSRVRGETRFVSAFSPCAEHRLAVFDLGDGSRVDVGPAGSARAVVQPPPDDEGEAAIFYLDDPAEEVTTLSVQYETARERLGPGTLAGIGLRGVEGTLVWLGDGKSGPLVRWAAGSVETLYDEVTAFESATYPERALVEDAQDKRLVALEGSLVGSVLARGATRTGRATSSALAFHASVKDDIGTLELLEFESGEVDRVAEDVFVPTASFFFGGESLFYQDEYDEARERGRLCMLLMANRDTFCEDDVGAFRVLNRPQRGVALVKREDNDEQHLFGPRWSEDVGRPIRTTSRLDSLLFSAVRRARGGKNGGKQAETWRW